MFDHLDDPSPRPAPPAGIAAARGMAIRNRRRLTYGGGMAAAGVALLLVTTVPGGGRPDALEIANDPSPTPSGTETYEPPVGSESPSPSGSASASASPASTPQRTATSTAPPTQTAPRPFDVGSLTPRRKPQPAIAACTASQVEETHPAGSQPPPGIEVTAEILSWTAKTTDRGAYWAIDLQVRNTTNAPFTFEDRGRAAGVYLDGRYVGGRPEGGSPYPQPSGGSRTLAPGEKTTLHEVSVSTWTCQRDVALPFGGYDLSAGVRTDSGTWYAPAIRGWVGNRMMGGTDCFRYDDAPGRVAPAAGLTLSVEGVPANVAAPDSSFTARLVVTNTSDRRVEFVDLEPAHRVAYLLPRGQTTVKGGWTSVGYDLPAKVHVLGPGERRTFDVVVRGEGCQTAEPITGAAYDVMLGIATVRDGQSYLWTVRSGPVTYPG